ncbi:MAG: glycosyltransferase [Planctomycetota bacterium]|nr:MAG: glycosyltransferase [Planctomycetota bacterium]REK31563.1 MAG: glycosyltransferase [Planctomycetota bacterium]REK43099.1 MAG: glycosyltransferase [Planctomycetota bacterium]
MISTVIPVYNEAESLPQLYDELTSVAGAQGYKLDIVFVDDGSTDNSWQVIERLAANDRRVHGIRFRRNFGKAAALSAGFDAVKGDLVMTLDADLQDDPKEIPHFLEKLGEGLDVVSGWKQVRHDPWHKVWPSRVFNAMVSRMTGVKLHDHNCGMKCYRREVLSEVRLYGEMHRFVPVLAASRGFRVGEIPIEHRARQHGESKYGVKRFVKGFLDLLTVVFLTGFGHRPQHLLGSLGLIAFMVGGFLMTWLAGRWAFSRLIDSWEVVHLHQTPVLAYSLALLLLGAQMLSMGFLAEMITAKTSRDADTYSVLQRTDGAGDDLPSHEDLEPREEAQSPLPRTSASSQRDQSLTGEA